MVLVQHLGLGDCILTSGLAVALSEREGEEVGFPCYSQYEASVKSFFVNHPKIRVYIVPNEGEWGCPKEDVYQQAIHDAGLGGTPQIKLGCYAGWFEDDFSKSFYKQAGIDYKERWDSCPIREASKSVPQLQWNGEPRIFLHDDPSRGFNITKSVNRQNAFIPSRNHVTGSILQYSTLVKTAKIGAYIDSSFFHFADCFDLEGEAQLHCYPRWPRPRDFRYESRNNWRYIW